MSISHQIEHVMNNKRLPSMPQGINYWTYKNDSWSWIPAHKSLPIVDVSAFWKDYYYNLELSKAQKNPSIIRKGGVSSQMVDYLVDKANSPF